MTDLKTFCPQFINPDYNGDLKFSEYEILTRLIWTWNFWSVPVCTGFKQDMIRPFLNSSREMEHNQTKFHSSKLHFNIYSTITTVRDNKKYN